MVTGLGLPYVASAMLATALVYMSAWWVLSVVMRRTDVADVGWGLGFVTLAWWGALVLAPKPIGGRVWLVAALVTVWGVRLAWHIARRNFARGTREDVRYAEMRLRWGRAWAVRSLFTVFLLQGSLMWVVALPIAVACSAKAPPLGVGRRRLLSQHGWWASASRPWAIGNSRRGWRCPRTAESRSPRACGRGPGIPTTSVTRSRGGESGCSCCPCRLGCSALSDRLR